MHITTNSNDHPQQNYQKISVDFAPPRARDRERLIALGWPDNEIDYLPREAIREILATVLHAPTLLYDPIFYEHGFEPRPITEYIRPDEEWRLSLEFADREIARRLVNICFDPPITDEEIREVAADYDLSFRYAEYIVRRSRQ
jgi:hypothetical protein